MALRPGHLVVDGTVGAGGHAAAFLEQVLPDGFLLGFDRDPQSAEAAERALVRAGYSRGSHFEIEVRRFSSLDEALAGRRTPGFDRLFLDVGVCSQHLDRPERGFSFREDGPLDMRMNPQEEGSTPAAQLVAELPERELERIFTGYGEERWARRIAQAIGRERGRKAITTTRHLREVVAGAIPRKAWPPQADPATRVFQALRIAVNGELEELDAVLKVAPGLANPGARIGIVSFHSLEDRRVKGAFRGWCQGCICPPEIPECRCNQKARFRPVTRRTVRASDEEVARNPRARSAKLRVVEKLGED